MKLDRNYRAAAIFPKKRFPDPFGSRLEDIGGALEGNNQYIYINNPSFPLLCNSLKNKLGCKVIDEKNHFPVIFATQTHIDDDLLGTQSPSFLALLLGSSAPAMAPATGSATQPGLSLVTDVPAQQLQIFCQKLKLLYFE